MSTILLPCDGSPPALRAARHAAAEAGSTTRVDLLYVMEAPDFEGRAAVTAPAGDTAAGMLHPAASSPVLAGRCPAPAARVLQDAATILAQAGVDYAVHWRTGDPASEIAAHARQHACSEIIMGTRGSGALASVVLGSVTLQVIEQVAAPVTLLR